jgi:hypothetical protein
VRGGGGGEGCYGGVQGGGGNFVLFKKGGDFVLGILFLCFRENKIEGKRVVVYNIYIL